MNIYILRFDFHDHGEHFVRSVHMTKKGALAERLRYLCDTLLGMELDPEDVELIDRICDNEIAKLSTVQIEDYLEDVDHIAEYAEIHSEIVIDQLYP